MSVFKHFTSLKSKIKLRVWGKKHCLKRHPKGARDTHWDIINSTIVVPTSKGTTLHSKISVKLKTRYDYQKTLSMKFLLNAYMEEETKSSKGSRECKKYNSFKYYIMKILRKPKDQGTYFSYK